MNPWRLFTTWKHLHGTRWHTLSPRQSAAEIYWRHDLEDCLRRESVAVAMTLTWSIYWIFGLFFPSGSRVKTTCEKHRHYGGWFLHLSGRGANRNRGGLSWLSAFYSQPSWQEVTSCSIVLHVHIVDWLLCVAMGKASRHNSGLGKKTWADVVAASATSRNPIGSQKSWHPIKL